MWFSKPERNNVALTELIDAVNALTKHHNSLVDTVEDLKAQHLKLRGRFYAAKPVKEHTDEPESRDELRARMVRTGRFIPGKNPVHEEK